MYTYDYTTTTANTSLPKAGKGSVIAILTFIVMSLGTVAYVKFNKYRGI